MSRHSPPHETKSPFVAAQLSLPLDYSQSERDDPSRNPGLSKGKRARRRRGRFATNLAILEQRGIGQASYTSANVNENKCQRQRFSLTPMLSTLITEANANRWTAGHGATLPSLRFGPHSQPGQGRAHVRRGSPGRLPADSVGRQQRRALLPILRLLRSVDLQVPPDFQMQGLRTPILGHVGNDLRFKSAHICWPSRFS